MENLTIRKYISPLVDKELFASEEEAIRELVYNYISSKVSELSHSIQEFEKKYKMEFLNFQNFVKEEIHLLKKEEGEKKKNLSKLVMTHEDDLQEWKAKREILDSWLELKGDI